MSEQNNFAGVDITQNFETEDIEKNKTMAGLAYIIFFLPLITCPDSKFAKYHANSSLILLLANIIGYVFVYVPFIGGVLSWVLRIIILIYWILGLVDALSARAKKYPVISDIVIIK
jgi:uncharacterized membrane protein